ncbi:MAG: Lrp/AsnC family transcriptional regulator [Nitrososphaerota archaeon]
MDLDEKDVSILNLLIQNARLSAVEIAARLSMPRATVQERIKRMISNGIIAKFTAIPDYKKIGIPVTAYILLSFRPDSNISQRALAEEIATIPDVYEVSLISGEWDIILKVRGKSVEDIGNLVLEKLRMTRGVERTETCVAFSVIKQEP